MAQLEKKAKTNLFVTADPLGDGQLMPLRVDSSKQPKEQSVRAAEAPKIRLGLSRVREDMGIKE